MSNSYLIGNQVRLSVTFNDCNFHSSYRALRAFIASNASFNRCKFGVDQPGGASFETAITYGGLGGVFDATFTDCEFDPAIPMVQQTGVAGDLFANNNTKSILRVANKNVDPSQQEIYQPAGYLSRDNSVYRTSSPSIKILPKSSGTPFEFSINVFAPNNKPVVVSGYMRKDAGYGSSNLPYVTISGLGVTPNTFTIDDANDVWQQFVVQATQETGTDGMLTVTFTMQSSSGTVWIDDVVAPVATAVNVGEFGYWANALPVQAVLANFVSANDVWNIQTDQLTLAGSIGKKVLELSDETKKKLLPFLV